MSFLDPGDIKDSDIIPPDDILEAYAKAPDHKKSAVTAILHPEAKFLFSFQRPLGPDLPETAFRGHAVYWAGLDHIQSLVFMVLNLFLMDNEEPERRMAALRGVAVFILSLPNHVKVEFQEILNSLHKEGG